MLKIRLLIIPVLALFLVLPVPTQAFTAKTGDLIYIAKDEVIGGNLYVAGSSIVIDGKVDGDVICGAQSVAINGEVAGDVICGAQSVVVDGTVGGNVRAAGNTISINGKVARNVNALGAAIILSPEATIGWDMLLIGGTGDIRGKINGELYGACPKVVIGGEIGKDVRIRLSDKIRGDKKSLDREDKSTSLTVTDNAKIGGSLIYTAGKQASISEQAQIAGEVKHNLPKIENFKKRNFDNWLWGRLYSIFSALIVGLVLISLWRRQVVELTDKMLAKFAPTIGWGAVVMFLAPIIGILLVVTVIGIPLALVLMGAWLIALFFSKIFVGIMVGRAILEKFWKKKKDSLLWAMIAGVVACWLIFSLPFLGWLLVLVASWWGLGGIWLYFKAKA